MNIWFIIGILCTIVMIIGIIVGIKSDWDSFASQLMVVLCGILLITFISVGIWNNVSVKKTEIRQLKEREQIVYQVKHLTEDSDKIKLNEWILTYNDWVNDVNTNKEIYGWFSWYKDLDMSNHTIIDLV